MRTSRASALVTCLGLVACTQVEPGSRRPAARDGVAVQGDTRALALYERHCAACHGVGGEADGPLATWIQPAPRPFADGVFSLVSTENGIPTDADLVASITQGLPGTGMPGFAWLAEADRRLLATHVRELGVAGRVRFACLIAEHEGAKFDAAAAEALARRQLTPGQVVAPLAPFPVDAERIERGRMLYLAACAACHGADGRGRPQTAAWRERFDVRLPRDFTRGVLRGGTSTEALHRRIVAGMPAAGMPPQQLPEPEMQALVAYVRSLLPKDAVDPGIATELVARRVAALPADPADPAWQGARRTLWPLRADPDAVPFVEVAALHDGNELAVRLSWPDGTRDASSTASPAPDAVAVQWSGADEPPFLAMGSAREAVQIWQWQAFAARDASGVADLLESPLRHRTDAAPDALPRLRQQAVAATVRGRETMPEFASGGRAIAVRQSWSNEAWSVVFRRQLGAKVAGELAFASGARVHFAVAVWNGSAGQRGPDKSITGWLPLRLAE